MWNSLADERGGFTKKQRKARFKDNARDRSFIEFYDFGEREDISDAILGPLHLYERNNDKILQYMTIQRRIFNCDPDIECFGHKLLKLIDAAPKNQCIQINMDGNRVNDSRVR